MKKNPPPLHELFVKAAFCEVCTAFVLCYILSSPSYQWILSILKTILAQVLALDTNTSFWKWLGAQWLLLSTTGYYFVHLGFPKCKQRNIYFQGSLLKYRRGFKPADSRGDQKVTNLYLTA